MNDRDFLNIRAERFKKVKSYLNQETKIKENTSTAKLLYIFVALLVIAAIIF